MCCCAGALFVSRRCRDLTSLSISINTHVLSDIWAMAAMTKSLPHLQKMSIESSRDSHGWRMKVMI